MSGRDFEFDAWSIFVRFVFELVINLHKLLWYSSQISSQIQNRSSYFVKHSV